MFAEDGNGAAIIGTAGWDKMKRLEIVDAAADLEGFSGLWRPGAPRGTPLPPIYLHEAKPTGLLESTKRCEKWPKAKPTKPNQSHGEDL